MVLKTLDSRLFKHQKFTKDFNMPIKQYYYKRFERLVRT